VERAQRNEVTHELKAAMRPRAVDGRRLLRELTTWNVSNAQSNWNETTLTSLSAVHQQSKETRK